MTRPWHEREGLFETILVLDGRPVFLTAHLSRLEASARRLGLPCPGTAVLASTCRARAAGREGRGRMRILLEVSGEVTVTLDTLGAADPARYEEGVKVALALRPGHPLGDRAGHKVLPYTPLQRAREEARRAGAFDVIFFEEGEIVLEGSASNLFAVLDGVLRTPPLSRPILPGITREWTLKAARAAGIETREEDVGLKDLLAAEEAFLTGSLMGIVPIRAVGDQTLKPGPVAARLRGAVFPESGP